MSLIFILHLISFFENPWVVCNQNSNHVGYPQELADEAKGISQGEFRWRHFHELVATVWQHTKAVNFLSVVHPARETVQVTRSRRQREGGRIVHRLIQIDCPKLASEYGKFMGGVDWNDQMTCVHNGQKQLQWYMPLVVKFLEIAAYNPHILDGHVRQHEPQGSGKYDLHCSKKQIVMALIGNTKAPQITSGHKKKTSGGSVTKCWPPFSWKRRGQKPPLCCLFGEAAPFAMWSWWQCPKCCQNNFQMYWVWCVLVHFKRTKLLQETPHSSWILAWYCCWQ